MMVTCPHCQGYPKREAHIYFGGGQGTWVLLVCHYCNGEGKVTDERATEYLGEHDEDALIKRAIERGVIDT